jgi:hypothetical protein
LAPALLPKFALLALLAEFQAQKIHDQADCEASHPADENIGKPNLNESSHRQQCAAC